MHNSDVHRVACDALAQPILIRALLKIAPNSDSCASNCSQRRVFRLNMYLCQGGGFGVAPLAVVHRHVCISQSMCIQHERLLVLA